MSTSPSSCGMTCSQVERTSSCDHRCRSRADCGRSDERGAASLGGERGQALRVLLGIGAVLPGGRVPDPKNRDVDRRPTVQRLPPWPGPPPRARTGDQITADVGEHSGAASTRTMRATREHRPPNRRGRRGAPFPLPYVADRQTWGVVLVLDRTSRSLISSAVSFICGISARPAWWSVSRCPRRGLARNDLLHV